jgi:hypothetical protein
MDRCENLGKAVHGISCTADAFLKAGVLTREEYDVIHSAIWGIVVDAHKERHDKLQKLEEPTSYE